MKIVHSIAVALVIIGALNWGLVGIADFNAVSAIFGVDTWATNLIYILVGVSGLVVIFTEFAVHRMTTTRPHREVTATHTA